MSTDLNKKNTDILILCGGLGTRLRSLFPDAPKALANINGMPFLDTLISVIYKQGFKKIILCVGHMKHKIIDHYSGESNLNIRYAIEKNLLGTGGAIKNALPLIEKPFFIAMNGDSYCDINLEDLIIFHLKTKADVSIVISTADPSRKDTGLINVDKFDKIVSFKEKSNYKSGLYLNAGIYVMNKNIIEKYEANKFSLEIDFLPSMIKTNKIYGFKTTNPVFDIGTPKRYQKFINLDIKNT